MPLLDGFIKFLKEKGLEKHHLQKKLLFLDAISRLMNSKLHTLKHTSFLQFWREVR